MADLVRGLDASKVIGLSTLGSFRTLKDLCDEISKFPRSILLIGGFPRGHFNKRILRLMDEVFRVYRETLDTWVIACRATHQFELSSGIFF